MLITELGAASLERWPGFIAELPEPVFFQRNGTLVVWHAGDRAEAPLFERRLRANAPSALFQSGFVKLSGAQVTAAEPSLGTRFPQGWLLPNEGQLDNRQVLKALAAGLAERDVGGAHTGRAPMRPVTMRSMMPTRIPCGATNRLR